MVRKSGNRFFEKIMLKQLEHDPEKACPGLDPGWKPVFGKDHAQTKPRAGYQSSKTYPALKAKSSMARA
jgi:hypothetical protein